MHFSQLLVAAAAVAPAFSQLSGTVGPLTTHATKTAKKTCNILNYGGKADKSTDVGPALLAAFTACKTGGTVVVPAGNYAMSTWVTFEGGKAWALQLDGIIYRTGTGAGNMMAIRNANDFEMFSSTGKGAIQGMFMYSGYMDLVNNRQAMVTKIMLMASETVLVSFALRRQTTSVSTTLSSSMRRCSILSCRLSPMVRLTTWRFVAVIGAVLMASMFGEPTSGSTT